MGNWATLFSDASRCVRTGACGWGGWIKREPLDKLEFSGLFKVDPDDIHEAEIQAIAKTLHASAKSEYLVRGGGVLIQSDSLSSLSWILGRIPGATDRPFADKGHKVTPYLNGSLGYTDNVRAAIGVIGQISEAGSLKICVRHVKAHKAGEGRNFVNRRCDELAKEMMQRRRVQLDVEARDRLRAERAALVRTAGANVVPLFRNVDIGGGDLVVSDGSEEVEGAIRASGFVR